MISPNVLVLLPLYKSTDFCNIQVASILSQKSVNVHILIYDDHHLKESLNLVKSTFHDTRLSFIETSFSFGNASKSFFYLIKNSSFSDFDFDYIALSDHDDVWGEEKLISSINFLVESSSNCYSSSVMSLDYKSGFKNPVFIDKFSKQSKYDFLFEGPGPGCTFVFDKIFFESLKPDLISYGHKLDDIFWHDWFIYIYSRIKGFNWFIDSSSHLLYFQRGKNETGSNIGLKALFTRFKWLLSGWYFKQSESMLYIIDKDNPLNSIYFFNFKSFFFLLFNIFSLRRSKIHSLVIFFLLSLRFFKK